MASLKELKLRIGSVKSTQKITKAKQMVAAAKLRKAQAAAEAARPYSERLEAVVASLATKIAGGSGEGASPLLAGTGIDPKSVDVAGKFMSAFVRATKPGKARLPLAAAVAQGAESSKREAGSRSCGCADDCSS